MKLCSIDDAAARLRLPESVLTAFEEAGLIAAQDQAGGKSYYAQSALDSLIQDLHGRLQRASWREMELRMEAVEARLDAMESSDGRQGASSSHLLG